MKAIVEAYASLVTSGGITPQDADETHFRELLDFPELDEAGIREKEPVPTEIDPNNPDPTQASERGLRKKPNEFSDGPFKPSRKLTFAEDKVDFDAIQQKMNALEDQFDAATKALLHEARDAYMAALTKAAHAKDTQAIKEATLKVQQDYARILKQAMQNAFDLRQEQCGQGNWRRCPRQPRRYSASDRYPGERDRRAAHFEDHSRQQERLCAVPLERRIVDRRARRGRSSRRGCDRHAHHRC